MVCCLVKNISCRPWNVTKKLNFCLGEGSNPYARTIVAIKRCCEVLRMGHIVNWESNDIDVHNRGTRKYPFANLDEQGTFKMRLKRDCNFRIQHLVECVTIKHTIVHHGRSTNETLL